MIMRQGQQLLLPANPLFILGSLLVNMAVNFPDAAVTETAAGHFLQEEVPQDIAAAIVRVLDAVERDASSRP